MRLAKDRIDIGLSTNAAEPMLTFWGRQAGLRFDHVLSLRKGHDQHRFDASGSVVKLNHFAAPLPETAPSGYRELLVATAEQPPRALSDPDGNLVSLVAPGTSGVTQIGVRLAVRNLDAHRRFYTEAFGFPEAGYAMGAAFRAGESLLLLEPRADAPQDASFDGAGWRYITLQVFKVDEEHRRVLDAGGSEAMAPRTLGRIARISMVRDPDGNWIELSQRASIVGSLE